MTTLLQEINLNGISLMDGKDSSVRVIPSEKKGIRFFPCNSSKSVTASVENVVSTQNCTVLGQDGQFVRLVEHFMAASAISGVDSIDVVMSGAEMPILDGSSKGWVDAFNQSGFNQRSEMEISITEPIHLIDGNSRIVMLPAEKLEISYGINFNHPELNNRWVKAGIEDIQSIIEARTFGYLKDLEKFQQAGMALGANIDNTVGLTDDGYTVELRSQYEPVKHKILDIIGDLYLTGYNPLNFKAQIIALDAGHKSHVAFAKVLKCYMEKSK